MILFLIKKTFFDMWDNLLSIIILNLGAILLIGGLLYLLQFFGVHPILFVLGVVFALAVLSLYIGTISLFASDIANFTSPDFKQFFPYLKEDWLASLAFGGIIVIQFFILTVALPWYFSRGNFLGIAIAGLLFWGSLIWILASQYYFPVRNRLNPGIRQTPLKCLLLFFDNTFFSIFLGIGAVVLLILSSLTAFLFPGLGTILLWYQVALKLRMYKYDYLESHPRINNKQIPWARLLVEDRKRVGHRSLRGMIFPWKE